jgi:hypothetical protein
MYLLLIMIKNITCLGHTGLLIIVWAPWPLNIVTIHYLKWGLKTWGVKNYNGISASCPYTNMNGVCPVNFLHVVLYAHNIVGIFKSQSTLFTLQILVKAFFKILLKDSTIPFA